MIKISAAVASLFILGSTVQAQEIYYPQTAAPTAALIAECKADAPTLGPEKLQARMEMCKTNPLYVMCLIEGLGRTSDQVAAAFVDRVGENCRRKIGYRPGEYEEEQKYVRQTNREQQNAYNAAKPLRDAENQRELEQIKQRNAESLREGLAERDRNIAKAKAREEANRPKEEAYQLNKQAMTIVEAQEGGFDKYHRILQQCTQETTQLYMQQHKLAADQRQPVENRAQQECRKLINTDIVQNSRR